MVPPPPGKIYSPSQISYLLQSATQLSLGRGGEKYVKAIGQLK